MSWRAYRVTFALRGPLHIGNARIGNLQRTRPYVIGRTLWGALTMRLTRALPRPAAADYRATGRQVHELLAATYFYLTSDPGGAAEPPWPWLGAQAWPFEARHMGSYAATAVAPRAQAAAQTTLHEVEALLPVTRDGRPVYLCGYLFEHESLDRAALDWPAALDRLQFGGERSYGWGGVRAHAVVRARPPAGEQELPLFGRDDVRAALDGARPLLRLAAGAPLLAHTAVHPDLAVRGRVEPLVGRIWAAGDGRALDYTAMCYLPGSTVAAPAVLEIGRFGLWRIPGHARPPT